MPSRLPRTINNSRRVMSTIRRRTSPRGPRHTNTNRPQATRRVNRYRANRSTTSRVRNPNKRTTSRRRGGASYAIFNRMTSIFGNDGTRYGTGNHEDRLIKVQLGSRGMRRRERRFRSLLTSEYSLCNNNRNATLIPPRRGTTSVDQGRTNNRTRRRRRNGTPKTTQYRRRKRRRKGHRTRGSIFGMNRKTPPTKCKTKD